MYDRLMLVSQTGHHQHLDILNTFYGVFMVQCVKLMPQIF